MSVGYAPVTWTPFKKLYDLTLLGLIVVYLFGFIIFHVLFQPEITIETLIIRAFGSLAFILLHVILIIGPLARINSKFLPLLYNRRHLGVITFLVALVHGIFNLMQFHLFGDTDVITSLFTSNTHYTSLVNFPFQSLGFLTLMIMAILAATSHDFWLRFLGPQLWKGLHMMIYLAYASVVAHVLLGVVQLEDHPFFIYSVLGGIIVVVGLHLTSAFMSRGATSRGVAREIDDNWVKVGHVENMPEGKAKIVELKNDSIAIFKYDGKLSAVRNKCSHQHGPLGEGKIIDGCITCPWHGYQYFPHNGQSPPPFKEKVCTYKLKIVNDIVWVDENPEDAGTEINPLII